MPPILFRTGPKGLAVSGQYEVLAVRYVQRGRHWSESLAVPGQVLQSVAGEGKSAVHLEKFKEDRALAVWEEGGQAREQEFASPDPDELPSFPDCSTDFQP